MLSPEQLVVVMLLVLGVFLVGLDFGRRRERARGERQVCAERVLRRMWRDEAKRWKAAAILLGFGEGKPEDGGQRTEDGGAELPAPWLRDADWWKGGGQ